MTAASIALVVGKLPFKQILRKESRAKFSLPHHFAKHACNTMMSQLSELRPFISEQDTSLYTEAELLYRFVVLYYTHSAKSKDYGYGPSVTMAEAHTLTKIDDQPGITVSQLAAHYSRTNGAMSQLVSKLEKKGLIMRKMVEDLRNAHLYTTPIGKGLSRVHRLYDCESTRKTRENIGTSCTPEEIDTFFKVLREFTAWFDKSNAHNI